MRLPGGDRPELEPSGGRRRRRRLCRPRRRGGLRQKPCCDCSKTGEERERRVGLGLEHVKEFTAEKFAERLLSVYRHVLEGR